MADTVATPMGMYINGSYVGQATFEYEQDAFEGFPGLGGIKYRPENRRMHVTMTEVVEALGKIGELSPVHTSAPETDSNVLDWWASKEGELI